MFLLTTLINLKAFLYNNIYHFSMCFALKCVTILLWELQYSQNSSVTMLVFLKFVIAMKNDLLKLDSRVTLSWTV
jgi:hypothetical protein